MRRNGWQPQRLRFLVCLGLAVLAETAQGEVRLSLLMASDYKQNGLSQTNSRPAVRFSTDYTHASGLFAGGFVSNAEYSWDYRLASQRDMLTNFYVGHQWRGERWASTVSISRYIYPGYKPNYDYTQTAAGVSYKNRYFLSLARSTDYPFAGQDTNQIRGGVALPWIWGLEAGLNAGEQRSSGIFDTGYSFWDAGLSRVFGRFALDLRYHDDTYGRAGVAGESGDNRWVLSITYAISPRGPAPDSR